MSELHFKRVLWTCYPLWTGHGANPVTLTEGYSCVFYQDFVAVDSQSSSRVPPDAEDNMC